MVVRITRYVDPDHPNTGYLKIDGSEFPVPKPERHRQILDLAALAALDASALPSRGRLISFAKESYAEAYGLEATLVEDQ
jgi:hypothetical protein